jgi:hypothetical protein
MDKKVRKRSRLKNNACSELDVAADIQLKKMDSRGN